MSKGFLSAVRRAFIAELPQTLPGFDLSPPIDRMRGVLFESRVTKCLWLFVNVSMAQYDDAFTLEVAWNCVRTFPFNIMPFPVVDENGAYSKEVLKAVAFRSRISGLMKLWRDTWWRGSEKPTLDGLMNDLRELGTGKMPKKYSRKAAGENPWPGLQETVRDACETLGRLALPYFHEVAKSHGIKK